MKKNFNYCITGGSGFVGSNLVEYIYKKNDYNKIVCLVRKTSDTSFLKNFPVDIEVVEFNKPSTYEKYIKECDYLFQLIGLTYGKNFDTFKYVNYKIAKNFFDLYLKHSDTIKGYFFMSSLAVVGPKKKDNRIENPNRKSNLNPITKYGKSKLLGEKIHWKYLNKNLNINILRAPSIYGKRDKEMKQFFDLIKKGVAPIIGRGNNKFTIINVTDLVEFIYYITINRDTPGIFYIYDDNIYTMNTFTKKSKTIINKKALKVKIPKFLVYIAAFINEKISKDYIFNRDKYMELTAESWAYKKNDFFIINKNKPKSLKEGLIELYG